jgi:hypothetical protein
MHLGYAVSRNNQAEDYNGAPHFLTTVRPPVLDVAAASKAASSPGSGPTHPGDHKHYLACVPADGNHMVLGDPSTATPLGGPHGLESAVEAAAAAGAKAGGEWGASDEGHEKRTKTPTSTSSIVPQT